MAKKKGKGKKTKPAGPAKAQMVDGATTDDLSKEQLIEHLLRQREELQREREERNYFQLERDRVTSFWNMTKKELETVNKELHNKDREIEDQDERHNVEIRVYKQKVKHLLYENQENLANVRSDVGQQLFVQYKQNSEKEGAMRTDNRIQHKILREAEMDHEENLKKLRREHDQRETMIVQDFDRHVREIEAKYEQQAKDIRSEIELQRKTELHEVTARKDAQIQNLIKKHEKAFIDIKNYYNDITLNNLAQVNSLKETIIRMRDEESRKDKKLTEVVEEHKKLIGPYNQAVKNIQILQHKLENYHQDRLSLNTNASNLKTAKNDFKQLAWKHEVLEQRYELAKKERDQIYNNFVKTIHDVQQKTGLKHLLLNKKIKAILDLLEKKEAQFNEVLAASNLDPKSLDAVTQKLEDVLDGKNAAIRDLQYELAKVCKIHNDALRAYEGGLKSHGVPKSELGFDPLESAVAGQKMTNVGSNVSL